MRVAMRRRVPRVPTVTESQPVERGRWGLALAVSLAVNMMLFLPLLGSTTATQIESARRVVIDLVTLPRSAVPPRPSPPLEPVAARRKPRAVRSVRPPKAPQTPAVAPDEQPVGPTPEADPRPEPAPAAIPEPAPPPAPRTADVTELDGVPRPVHTVNPRIPPLLLRTGGTGLVILRVLIGPAGEVRRVEVVKSMASLGLDDPAVAAVRQWRYSAPRVRNQPVSAWLNQPISFRPR